MPAGFKVIALNNSVVPVYVGLGRVGRVVMQRIANPCTPVRFRYPPPQHVVNPQENNIPKQDIVRNFLYTIRTQNIGVDFYFLTLVH